MKQIRWMKSGEALLFRWQGGCRDGYWQYRNAPCAVVSPGDDCAMRGRDALVGIANDPLASHQRCWPRQCRELQRLGQQSILNRRLGVRHRWSFLQWNPTFLFPSVSQEAARLSSGCGHDMYRNYQHLYVALPDRCAMRGPQQLPHENVLLAHRVIA
jgi:hypothetical protein